MTLIFSEAKNRFYWYSQNRGGGVVDLYKDKDLGKNISFAQAIKELGTEINPDLVINIKEKEIDDPSNYEPEKRAIKRIKEIHENLKEQNIQLSNSNTSDVKRYLIKTRGIDSGSKFRGDVKGCNYDRGWFFDPTFSPEGMFYQKDRFEEYRHAIMTGDNETIRSFEYHKKPIYSKNKVNGEREIVDYTDEWVRNRRGDGFNFGDGRVIGHLNQNKLLLVFESSIEMMSYMNMLKLSNVDYKKFAYLSCGSVSKTKCVEETLKTYGYNRTVIMFNNDSPELRPDRSAEDLTNVGKEQAEKLVQELKNKGYAAKALIPSKYNDWNDTLRAIKRGEYSPLNLKKVKENKTQEKEL